MIRTNKYRLITKLITFIVITFFLCQNMVWAYTKRSLVNSSLQVDSAFDGNPNNNNWQEEFRQEYCTREGIAQRTGLERGIDKQRSPHYEQSQDSKIEISLINLSSPNYPSIDAPLGLYVLKGYLDTNLGDEVVSSILDTQLESIENIVDYIVKRKPRVLGVSLQIGTLDILENILNNISQRLSPDQMPLLVLGKNVSTFSTEEILKKYPEAICAIGEGELAMQGIISYLKGRMALRDIKNIAFKENGIVRYTERALLTDLSVLGNPDFSQIDRIIKLGGGISIETSRGCQWGRCRFCSGSHYFGCIGSWRPRPIEDVIKELKILENAGVQRCFFVDEEFFGPGKEALERARTLARAIIDNGINIKFSINTRCDSIYKRKDAGEREEVLRLLQQAGLQDVFLGVESGSRTQLKRYFKGLGTKTAIAAIETLRKLGLNIRIGWIMFDPLITKEELRENLEFIRKNNILNMMSAPLNVMRLYDNTEYMILIRKKEQELGRPLLGQYDFDTISYPIIDYEHTEVKRIAELAKNYFDDYYGFFYALKSRVRFLTGRDAEYYRCLVKYLSLFKDLEMDLLYGLTGLSSDDLLKSDRGSRLLEDFYLRRDCLIQQLLIEIQKIGNPKACEKIIDESNKLLGKRRGGIFNSENGYWKEWFEDRLYIIIRSANDQIQDKDIKNISEILYRYFVDFCSGCIDVVEVEKYISQYGTYEQVEIYHHIQSLSIDISGVIENIYETFKIAKTYFRDIFYIGQTTFAGICSRDEIENIIREGNLFELITESTENKYFDYMVIQRKEDLIKLYILIPKYSESDEDIDRDALWRKRVEIREYLQKQFNITLSAIMIVRLVFSSDKFVVGKDMDSSEVFYRTFCATQRSIMKWARRYLDGEQYDAKRNILGSKSYSHIQLFSRIYVQEAGIMYQYSKDLSEGHTLSVLDIGCQGGNLFFTANEVLGEAKERIKFTGIDILKEYGITMGQRFAEENGHGNITFSENKYEISDEWKRDIMSNNQGRKYDFVVVNHVLEHLEQGDPVDYINDWLQIAKNGVVLSVPYEEVSASLSAGHHKIFNVRKMEDIVAQLKKIHGDSVSFDVGGLSYGLLVIYKNSTRRSNTVPSPIISARDPAQVLRYAPVAQRKVSLVTPYTFNEKLVSLVLQVGSLMFSPTNRCNLQCDYCAHMHDTAVFPFDSLDALQQLSPRVIELMGGGEPTLYINGSKNFNDLILRLRQLFPDVEIKLFTNGVIIPDGDWQKEVSWIRISMDAATNETFNHLKKRCVLPNVLQNLKIYLMGPIPRVQVSFVFGRQNAKEAVKFIRLLYNLLQDLKDSVPSEKLAQFTIQFRPIAHFAPWGVLTNWQTYESAYETEDQRRSLSVEIETLRREIPEFLERHTNYRVLLEEHNTPSIMGSFRCLYGLVSPFLTAEGFIYPCCIMVLLKKYAFGNILFDKAMDLAKRHLEFCLNPPPYCKQHCRFCRENLALERAMSDVSSNEQTIESSV